MILVKCDPFGRCQLHINIIIEQLHGIVAGACLFVLVRIAGGIPAAGNFFLSLVCLYGARIRHHQHIRQIADARTAQVRLCKSDQHAVAVGIA